MPLWLLELHALAGRRHWSSRRRTMLRKFRCFPRTSMLRLGFSSGFTESPISRCFTWFGDHGGLQLVRRIALDVRCHGPVVILHCKFTGKERDAESGLDNFGARYDAGKPLLKKREKGPCRTAKHLTLRCPEAAPRPFSSHFSCTVITDTEPQSCNNSPTVQHRKTAPVSRDGLKIRRKTIFGGSLKSGRQVHK